MNEPAGRLDNRPEWIKIISRYNFPDPGRSWWQVINSIVPYVILWIAMIFSLRISYWLTLGLSVITAGFMVRIFIIFHDCGHGSFFKSARLNTIVGTITGLMTFTPFRMWTYEHKIHHQTVGNLDKRGIGDVMTLTVEEYLNLPWLKKFGYRLYRNPIFLFLVAPPLIFIFLHRATKRYMSLKEKLLQHLSNIAVAAFVTGLVLLMGWKAYLMIQLPVLYIGTVQGVWLFYVQHQFRDVKWERTEKWDYKNIALAGSSMFKLPSLLNWFTGNIGFHHIHHLSPMIPNYKLKSCHYENTMFSDIVPITFITAFRSLRLRLWDEKRQVLVGFREI
ncbi:MAG TPA: fatty acid desaturase [Bacteroidales bacterium]|nr:fatty acid desaturase [Bacteroidales bacterium]